MVFVTYPSRISAATEKVCSALYCLSMRLCIHYSLCICVL